jgi:tRNA(fMet)-specific endonuclease VapC
VLDFPDMAAGHYAKIRADLKARGEMIGVNDLVNDLLIAAHVRSLGLTLVTASQDPLTNNTREFGRVHDLKAENWTL